MLWRLRQLGLGAEKSAAFPFENVRMRELFPSRPNFTSSFTIHWYVIDCSPHPLRAPICNRRIEKRAKYSRRRAYNDDADIDYINERNAKFNKKAERFYGKYTAEIKQNLERGTAV